MRAYVIGDIHGQFEMLRAAHQRVEADRTRAGDDQSPLIHLGDLTDRGPDSDKVIELLMQGKRAGNPWITLRGNHDQLFLQFLTDPQAPTPGLRPDFTWLHPALGGIETLASYGIKDVDRFTPQKLQVEIVKRVPKSHIEFLSSLPLSYQTGGVFFVHAGIRPGVPFDKQSAEDMMWIRKEFHNDKRDHGMLVVHGHTPVKTATHYGNRVNLDTGAGYNDPLTAAVIENGEVSLLTDEGRIPLPAPSSLRRFFGIRR